MNKEKYTSPDYVADNNTHSEIQDLNKDKQNLSNFNLKNAQLNDIYLVDAIMKDCDLSKSNLKNASMYNANLSGSNLFKANLENANLKNSNLEGCNLLGANLNNTKLDGVTWGKGYKVINEIEAEQAYDKGDFEKSKERYREAEEVYRAIKINMQSQTLGDHTGEFFIREMVSKRKQFNKFSMARIGSKIIELTTGYGEKLRNIVFTIIGIIITCMFLYGIQGVSYDDKIIGFFSSDYNLLTTLGNLFYFSVVVYSTVGFGEMIPIGPLGKTVMIFEGIAGGLVLAILIIALYKKTMDR